MKTIKKILAVVMIASLMLGLFAICASAAPAAPLTIAGTQILDTTGEKTITGNDCISGTVKYDVDNHTITLDNATITANPNGGQQDLKDPIYYKDDYDLTIIVKGDCTLDCSEDDVNAIVSYKSNRSIKIIGNGDNAKLTIKMKQNYQAIFVNYEDFEKGDLSVKDLTLDISYGTMGANHCLVANNINFENCNVKIKDASKGIVARNNVTITDSTLDVNTYVDGICALGDTDCKITIKNSDIKTVENRAAYREAFFDMYGGEYDDYYTAPGKCNIIFSCGLHSEGNVEISDSNLDIFSDETCGIFAKGSVAFKNCTGKVVTTTTGDERAVYAPTVTVTNTPLTAGNTKSDAKSAVLGTNLMDYKYVEFIDTSVSPTPPAKEEEKEKETEEVAQTGDNTVIATFVAASALSAAAFVSLKKKEQY